MSQTSGCHIGQPVSWTASRARVARRGSAIDEASRPSGSGHRYGSAARNATSAQRQERRRSAASAAEARGGSRRVDARTRSAQSMTMARPATPYRYFPAQASPKATAAAPSQAARRRPATPGRQARVESTTASSAKKAGTASSITWLEYLMLHVWSASHSAAERRHERPAGRPSARRRPPRRCAPTDEVRLRQVVVRPRGRRRRPGSRGRARAARARGPATIFASGGCSGR